MTKAFAMNEALPFILPGGYEKNDTGIFKIVIEKGKDGTTRTDKIALSLTPFEITRQFDNPDSGEVLFEITFAGRSVVVSGADLSNKKGIIQLAGHGLNTVESRSRDLCLYIMGVRALNDIPRALLYDRMGWKADGSFLLGTQKISKTGTETVGITTSGKQLSALRAQGTLKGWIAAVSGMLEYSNQRFKVYCACAAPLLALIDAANLSLSDTGDTSIGKTVTCALAMSIYGDPEDLVFSGNTTKVGVERLLVQFCDLPVNLDDCQNIDGKLLNQILYMLGNGVGKIRGAKEGGLQEVAAWRSVGLLTSEVPVITETSLGGLGARVLEMVKGGLGKTDIDAVTAFENSVKNHFGVFAPLYIRYLIEHGDDVRKTHAESLKKIDAVKGAFAFDEKMLGLASRISGTFAAVLTAGTIFEKLYGDAGGARRDAEVIVTEMYRKMLPAREGESYCSRGLAHVLSWIAANASNFLDNGLRSVDKEGSKKLYRVFGDIRDDKYVLLTSELRAELDRAKFNYERLLNDFDEAGYIEKDGDRTGRKLKTVKIEGRTLKGVVLKRSAVDSQTHDSENGGKS